MKSLIVLLMISLISAQQLTTKGGVLCLRTDGNNQFYVLETNKLTRYSAEGRENGVYSDFRQGAFSQLDVSNPMKVLVFHEDMQRISMLDRSLNLIRVIQLADRGIMQAGSVCLAANGDLWVFDIADMRLKRVRELGAPIILTESQPLTLVPGISADPLQMIEHNGAVYLAEKTQGILQFDQLGNFNRRIPCTELRSMQLFKHKLYVFTGHSFIRFGEDNLQADTLGVPAASQMAISESLCLRLQSDSLVFMTFP
jgi:hypothetical protein